MRVKEVMTPKLKTVAPSASADAAWETMKAANIHHLVVKDGSRLAGVFSSGDAGRGRGKTLRDGLRVADLMSTHVVTISGNAPLKRAAAMMRGRNVGCLVVVDSGRPIGIVTTSDLLELVGRSAVRPSTVSTRPALNFNTPHRKRHVAYGAW